MVPLRRAIAQGSSASFPSSPSLPFEPAAPRHCRHYRDRSGIRQTATAAAMTKRATGVATPAVLSVLLHVADVLTWQALAVDLRLVFGSQSGD